MKEAIAGAVLLVVVIVISLFLGRDIKPDVYHTKECGHLTGSEYKYCVQQIDQMRGIEEDLNQSKSIRNIP